MANKQIIFSIIDNLQLEKDTVFNFLDWKITNDPKIISKNILDINKFIFISGKNHIDELFSKTVAFKIIELNVDINYHSILHQETNGLLAALSLLWFTGDNSINSSIQSIQDANTQNIYINRRDNFVSTSKGSYSLFFLNKEIIDKIHDYKLLEEYSDLLHFIDEETENDIKLAYKSEIENIYPNINRLKRSFLLLNIARVNDFLPMKIAFYINVLECLLLSDNLELSFRLQTHTANLIGKNKDDKVFIRDTINIAYGIRSSFFHGSIIKKTLLELQTISEQLDDIIRTTLIKAISIKNIINHKDKNVLANYLKSIMFS